MKKTDLGKKIGCCLGAILLSPILIFVLLGLVFYTPFDYVKFKKSSYCKDTDAKYVWLVTTSATYKIYEITKKEGLSIDFYKKPDASSALGYFVKDSTLLLQDSEGGFFYDQTRESWRIISDGVEKSLLVFFEECKEQFTKAHGVKVDRCVIMMSESDEMDAEEKARAESSGYFLIYNKKNLTEALRRFAQ